MLQENQRESDKKHYSIFFPEDDRSKSLFINPQNLYGFLEFTNHYSKKEPEILQKVEQQDEKNQEKVTKYMIQCDQEPRYVNQKQYHRIMIRRIKRAQQALKMEEERKKQMLLADKSNQKYRYESRHQHALKRERGPDGKFLKKTLDPLKTNDYIKKEQDGTKLE